MGHPIDQIQPAHYLLLQEIQEAVQVWDHLSQLPSSATCTSTMITVWTLQIAPPLKRLWQIPVPSQDLPNLIEQLSACREVFRSRDDHRIAEGYFERFTSTITVLRSRNAR